MFKNHLKFVANEIVQHITSSCWKNKLLKNKIHFIYCTPWYKEVHNSGMVHFRTQLFYYFFHIFGCSIDCNYLFLKISTFIFCWLCIFDCHVMATPIFQKIATIVFFHIKSSQDHISIKKLLLTTPCTRR